MPFRYITEGGEPKLPPGMRQLLYDDLDKSLDFFDSRNEVVDQDDGT